MIRYSVKQPSYPTFERNGLILTYMGPKDKQPLVPNYEWLTLPADHVDVEGKFWNENNWLQSIEGDCDSSHLYYLHRTAVDGSLELAPGMGTHLRFENEVGPWWIKTAAMRFTAPGEQYVRTNMFMLPCMGGPPQTSVDGISDGFQAVHQVPADDTHTWRIDVFTRRSGPIPARPGRGIVQSWPGLDGPTPAVGPEWRKTANRTSNYLLSREKQQSSVYCGIPFGPHTQDAAMTESMGPIVDREHEHLGMGDSQIVAIRQLLLRAVRAVQEGQDPPGVVFRDEDNRFNLDLVHATIPVGAPWQDIAAMREHMLVAGARPGLLRPV